MRRLFWIAFGATVGVLVARRVREAAAELTPSNVATKTWAGVRDTWNDIREVAADREDELRESFGLDGGEDKQPGSGADERA